MALAPLLWCPVAVTGRSTALISSFRSRAYSGLVGLPLVVVLLLHYQFDIVQSATVAVFKREEIGTGSEVGGI